MCGITGFYQIDDQRSRSELHVIGKKMAQTILHRGPDCGDIWQDPDRPLLLCHRRLSILDLSDLGKQPMMSQSQRYVIIYNGEVYNAPSLRKELGLKGLTFKGRSDTEVILGAIEYWGFNQALQKLNGMFAFALWDRDKDMLHLVRDRMGQKPLYCGWSGKNLVFGSELKAMAAHPDFDPDLSKEALYGYMQYGCVRAPHCIYKNCWQIPPGHRLSINLSTLRVEENLAAHMKPYWNALDKLAEARVRGTDKKEEELVEEFEALFKTCVSDRLLSDVPLGAFLSGGLDSSAVVAMMQEIGTGKTKTYSIGFEDHNYNEAPHAREVADYLGTDHHEQICTAEDVRNIIPTLPDIYDEPFADISANPTYLLSAFARKDVTVALSGDGGDEMLGGYSRHVQGQKIWKNMRLMPRIMRTGLSNFIQNVPTASLDSLNRKYPQFGIKLHKAASILSLDTQEEIYMRLTQKWPHPPLLNKKEYPAQFCEMDIELTIAEKMMFWDTISYLPNAILTKTDRASMAHSLELRSPFLDHRIYEYAWRLPENLKIKGGRGKYLLRQVLKRHMPEEIFERPKQGFSIPIGEWLRGPLKSWADELLDEKQLNEQGLLNTKQIHRIWSAHLDGQGHHGDALWTVLMFQAWYQKWMA